MSFNIERKDESRELLSKAFFFALGSYLEQEVKKEDQWRDQSIGNLFSHLKHEIEEVKRDMQSGNFTHLMHDCVDAAMLSTILLARVMEENNLMQ